MTTNQTAKVLLTPKFKLTKGYLARKTFFLAGPIRGGGKWQMRAANAIWKKYPGSVVVDPTRWDQALKNASTEEHLSILAHLSYSVGELDMESYPSQAPWERHYMRRAAILGKLLFWFERESQDDPRPKDEGVYAQDTRVEAGIWIERIQTDPVLRVRFGGHWELDENGRETKNSFGGLNFIYYYLTGEADRNKIYRGEVRHPSLILANSVEEFIEKAI